MDPISQAAIAGSLSGALAPQNKLKLWVIVGSLAGLAPDLDVLIHSSTDPLIALEYHRHFTHSLFFAPVIGLLFVAVAKLASLKKKQEWFHPKDLFKAATIGALTHGMLDACTSYGTQLLWPFQATRFSWNLVSIVDPVPTLFCCLFIALALGGTVRNLKVNPRLFCILGFLSFSLYLGWGFFQNVKAQNLQHALAEKRGHNIEKQIVKPTLLNTLVYRSVYLSEGKYWIDSFRIIPFHIAQVALGDSVPEFDWKNAENFRDSDKQNQDMQRFAKLTDGYLTKTRAGTLSDVRYSMVAHEARPMWSLSYQPQDPSHHVILNVQRKMSATERKNFFAFLFEGACPSSNCLFIHLQMP